MKQFGLSEWCCELVSDKGERRAERYLSSFDNDWWDVMDVDFLSCLTSVAFSEDIVLEHNRANW